MDEKEKERESKPAFSVTSELESVSVQTIPSSAFAVPAGFKKITP